MNIAEVHRVAVEGLTERVESIRDDQWELPTPDTEWNVRDLVQHLVNGTLWVKPLLDGMTIEEVGDRFDGDLLGDDPKGAWRAAAAQAVEAVLEPGAVERIVHISAGDTKAENYILERIGDAAMHTWDLSRALGVDDTLDPEVVEASLLLLDRVGDLWRSWGALAPVVPTAPDADLQTRFVAGSGRSPDWTSPAG
jgi:uncharacterized protein (TIGR03086 family)